MDVMTKDSHPPDEDGREEGNKPPTQRLSTDHVEVCFTDSLVFY
jgi:hypothetical protein